MVSRPCRRRRPSSRDDGGISGLFSSYSGILELLIGRTEAKAETPILWPPHAKSWVIGKDPDAGRDWRQEEKGTTEDEMPGWHHRLDGHEFG